MERGRPSHTRKKRFYAISCASSGLTLLLRIKGLGSRHAATVHVLPCVCAVPLKTGSDSDHRDTLAEKKKLNLNHAESLRARPRISQLVRCDANDLAGLEPLGILAASEHLTDGHKASLITLCESSCVSQSRSQTRTNSSPKQHSITRYVKSCAAC